MAIAKNARELPYNAQAEQAVLGSALLSRECLYSVFSMLNEEDFFLGKHQLIYRAIKSLFDKQTPVDVLTVTEELMNMKELETIGGVEYLQQCSDAMVALSSIDYYINIVNDQAVLPTDGRAATIIMSPGWKPWVMSFNLSKPVVKPVTPSALTSFGVSMVIFTLSATSFALWNSATLLFSTASLMMFSLVATNSLTSVISSFKYEASISLHD